MAPPFANCLVRFLFGFGNGLVVLTRMVLLKDELFSLCVIPSWHVKAKQIKHIFHELLNQQMPIQKRGFWVPFRPSFDIMLNI